MRYSVTLLVALSLLASAGCFGKEADPKPAATPPGTSAEGTDTGATTSDPTVPAVEPPAPPAPREIHTDTHTFAAAPAPGAPDPADPTGALGGAALIKPFAMPAEFKRLSASVTFTPTAPLPAGVGQGILVSLVDAAGTSLGTCAPTIPLQEAEVCTIEAPSLPGEHALRFEGTGTVDALVSIVAS